LSLLVFLLFLVVGGFLLGALARLAVPGPDPMPLWLTLAIGIGGSIVGGLAEDLVGPGACFTPTSARSCSSHPLPAIRPETGNHGARGESTAHARLGPCAVSAGQPVFSKPAVGTPLELHKEEQMGIIAFIILGLLAGALAKALLPGDDPGGFIVTALIGVAGALIGGFLAGAIFDADPMDEFFDISTWLTAIIGSIILLLIYRAVIGRRHSPAV
jgi:uncharacterized membrane protein YeaQ/YmgE (transglycosylase-associated protein family)